MNTWLNVSILAKITFYISPYNIFLNDSNGHGFYFLKCYYFNIWIIHVQSPTNFPKFMWELVINVVDVILKFGSPKRKTYKIYRNNAHLKLSKNMLLE